MGPGGAGVGPAVIAATVAVVDVAVLLLLLRPARGLAHFLVQQLLLLLLRSVLLLLLLLLRGWRCRRRVPAAAVGVRRHLCDGAGGDGGQAVLAWVCCMVLAGCRVQGGSGRAWWGRGGRRGLACGRRGRRSALSTAAGSNGGFEVGGTAVALPIAAHSRLMAIGSTETSQSCQNGTERKAPRV